MGGQNFSGQAPSEVVCQTSYETGPYWMKIYFMSRLAAWQFWVYKHSLAGLDNTFLQAVIFHLKGNTFSRGSSISRKSTVSCSKHNLFGTILKLLMWGFQFRPQIGGRVPPPRKSAPRSHGVFRSVLSCIVPLKGAHMYLTFTCVYDKQLNALYKRNRVPINVCM